ncbi:hypothetical protein ACP275_10G130100 [Erythranthe tilingii]
MFCFATVSVLIFFFFFFFFVFFWENSEKFRKFPKISENFRKISEKFPKISENSENEYFRKIPIFRKFRKNRNRNHFLNSEKIGIGIGSRFGVPKKIGNFPKHPNPIRSVRFPPLGTRKVYPFFFFFKWK